VAASNEALTERVLSIVDVVKSVASELDRTPSQVALAWTLLEPGVTSPIVGARTLAQLQDNLKALEVRFTEEQKQRLDAVSRIDRGFPHEFLERPMTRAVIFGDVKIAGVTA
jgi:aryl-alcohol dehydrogenase-like predicted oxidoreductase